jgi:hypothetical protein
MPGAIGTSYFFSSPPLLSPRKILKVACCDIDFALENED